MTQRGRPAVTRARVLNYWRRHGPCPVRQICRALEVERSWAKRTLKLLAETGQIILPPSQS